MARSDGSFGQGGAPARARAAGDASGQRIAPIAQDRAPWYLRLILSAQRRKYGRPHENEIVELTALVAFQNLTSKFNAALGIPAQGFCVVPRASPPNKGAP